jgi:hypothetical protein
METQAAQVQCPYCGESFTTWIDTSAGDQRYWEDCQVCCAPIEFSIAVGSDGQLEALQTRRDDE